MGGASTADNADTIPFAVIVLAAGRSRRMGGACKQLLPWGDTCLLRATLQPWVALRPVSMVVVLAAEEQPAQAGLAAQLAELNPTLVHNPDPDAGMGRSLALGAAALTLPVTGFFVALGDMPLVKTTTLQTLIAAFRRHRSAGVAAPVIVPAFKGRRGHPVLFDAARRSALTTLDGDRGAKMLLQNWGDAVVPAPVSDVGVTIDIDTPDAYQRWRPLL